VRDPVVVCNCVRMLRQCRISKQKAQKYPFGRSPGMCAKLALVIEHGGASLTRELSAFAMLYHVILQIIVAGSHKVAERAFVWLLILK